MSDDAILDPEGTPHIGRKSNNRAHGTNVSRPAKVDFRSESMNRTNAKELFLVVILLLVVFASVMDIYSDLRHGATGTHIAKEIVVVLIAAVGAGWLLAGMRQQRARIAVLRAELDESRRPAKPPGDYVLNARRQLGEVIAQQFEEWGLSVSEKEVGLLLLKGLSLKEIAALRATLEKTVRQQASSIYRKAGVSGRHAFAAWFIEDYL